MERLFGLFFFIPKTDKSKFRPIFVLLHIEDFGTYVGQSFAWWLEYHSKFGVLIRFSQTALVYWQAVLYGEIIKYFQEDTAVSAACLDIQSAYDNVLADVFVDKLVIFGIPDILFTIWSQLSGWPVGIVF